MTDCRLRVFTVCRNIQYWTDVKYRRADNSLPVSFTVSAWEWVYATNLSRLQGETREREREKQANGTWEKHTAILVPQRLSSYWGKIVSLRMLTNLRLANLRLTTAQQRTTGQNLPSDLYRLETFFWTFLFLKIMKHNKKFKLPEKLALPLCRLLCYLNDIRILSQINPIHFLLSYSLRFSKKPCLAHCQTQAGKETQWRHISLSLKWLRASSQNCAVCATPPRFWRDYSFQNY
jgi:hypothetical protein